MSRICLTVEIYSRRGVPDFFQNLFEPFPFIKAIVEKTEIEKWTLQAY